MNGNGFNGSTVTLYGILIRMFFDNRTPLAGSWREVAERDLQPRFVGQFLQLRFQQSHSRAVAAYTVLCNQRPTGKSFRGKCSREAAGREATEEGLASGVSGIGGVKTLSLGFCGAAC